MDDGKQIKCEVFLGINAVKPQWACRLYGVGDPTPGALFRGLLYEIIGPAFLFALAFTLLKFALLGHF